MKPRSIPALAAAVTAVAAVVTAAAVAFAAARDAGTGYELQNVEVMDPSMRLPEARRYMVAFNEALGVQCRDCHVLRDFASDEKPLKLVAREMMKMQVELNEQHFPGQGERINCWTCHRGERIPPLSSGLTDAKRDAVLQEVEKETAED